MNSMKIAVFGTVRNCARTIKTEFDRIDNALQDFDEVQYFLVESDSSDQSTEVLEQLKQQTSNFDYVSLGLLKATYPARTQRIAHCRNRYLDELKKESYQKFDYVLIADFDGTNAKLTKEGVASCWTFKGWDVCTANQADIYYDIMALRHPLWSPNDWHEAYNFLVDELGVNSNEAFQNTVRARQLKIKTSCRPIKVHSAFGGLAIYKREAIQDARYIGLDERGEEICEHVPFHAAMRERGCAIYINPKLINCDAPKEHKTLSRQRTILKWIEIVYPNFTQTKLFTRLKEKFKQ